MNALRKVTLLISIFTSFAVVAKSPVWQVSDGNNSVYIGGTVHVLAQSDYPLPESFEKAYQQAQVVVFETDMSKMQTMEFQQSLVSKMVFQDGRTYADVLDAKTVAQLEAYMQKKGIPLAQMQVFKPAMLAINLTMLELQSLGLAHTGVDEFYRQKGANDKKSFLFLETPEQQLDYLAGLGEGNENEMIQYTLNDIASLAQEMGELKSAWRSGNNELLFEKGAQEMKDLFPSTYNKMLVERNDNWLPHLEQYLKTKETEIVLVGALHLVGEDGVLNKLKAKGYSVKQLP